VSVSAKTNWIENTATIKNINIFKELILPLTSKKEENGDFFLSRKLLSNGKANSLPSVF
jgi:hypothetical protein